MDDTIRIYRNNFWLALIGVVSLVIAVAMGLSCLDPMNLFSGLSLGFFSLIFAFVGIMNLRRANDESPAIEVSVEGLLAKDVSSAVIPWSCIVGANLWRNRAAWNITLQLAPGQMTAIQPKFGSRRPFSKDKVAFMASYLGQSPSDLHALIQSRIGKR